MPTYEVRVITSGGTDSHVEVVDAAGPDQAKRAAVEIANAKAKANGMNSNYKAQSVKQL